MIDIFLKIEFDTHFLGLPGWHLTHIYLIFQDGVRYYIYFPGWHLKKVLLVLPGSGLVFTCFARIVFGTYLLFVGTYSLVLVLVYLFCQGLVGLTVPPIHHQLP